MHDPFSARNQAIRTPVIAGTDGLEDLLLWTGQGDREAFTRLYGHTSGRIQGLVRRVILDQVRSNETVQDVYVEVWLTAARFDPSRGSPLAWLTAITHRRAVERARSDHSSAGKAARWTAVSRIIKHEKATEAATDRIGTENFLSQQAALTDPQREAMNLAYWGGFTYRETAELLGVSELTVKSRICDGLRLLKTALDVP
ncbi:sigma-70 family RNA polymerase sigma factor [Arthrobacter sp. HLT1-21]